MVAPEAACANLRRLARDGQLGAYGFYEAIDYTPARLPPGKDQRHGAVVHGAPPGHDVPVARVRCCSTGRCSGASTPTRRSARPSCCSRSACRERRAIYPASGRGVVERARRRPRPSTTLRVFTTPNTPAPEVHLLSNGRYHVAITNAGGGYSRWRDLAVTRWHEDPTRDAGARSATCATSTTRRVLVGRAPADAARGHAATRRSSRRAAPSSAAAIDDIDTHVEISVSPEDDIELRRISLTNRGRTRAHDRADELRRGRARARRRPTPRIRRSRNLFVQTELVRDAAGDPVHAPAALRRRAAAVDDAPDDRARHGRRRRRRTRPSRAEFIGRGRSVADPDRDASRRRSPNSEGSVLDPIVAIRNTRRARARRDGADPRRHRRRRDARRRARRWSRSIAIATPPTACSSWRGRTARSCSAGSTPPNADTQLYERLASNVLYANPALRAPSSVIARNRRGQSGLWAYGISGDLPIVLVRIARRRAHRSRAPAGQGARLLAAEGAGRRSRDLERGPLGLPPGPAGRDHGGDRARSSDASLLDKPGGIFVRRSEQMSEEDRVLMQTVARLIVSRHRRHARRADRAAGRAPSSRRRCSPADAAPRAVAPTRGRGRRSNAPDLVDFNGLGGFTPRRPRVRHHDHAATRARRRRGSTCSPTRGSAPSSARAAARTPGARTRTAIG